MATMSASVRLGQRTAAQMMTDLKPQIETLLKG